MMDYDVVIIGAGPAGCAAAYDLCAYKRHVLLLDKHEFPREKACAGGLTPKTLKALRYSVEPVIKNVCSRMVVGKGMHQKVMFNSRHPICAMTIRSQFDAFCLEKTLKRGASFHVAKTIDRIDETDAHVDVYTDKGSIRSKYLIGADGANSRVRKLTQAFNGIKKGFGIEGVLPMDKASKTEMELNFDGAVSGYGWVFPKDDHMNVGLYSSTGSEKRLKQKLIQYAKSRFGYDTVDRVKGYPLGTGGWNYTPRRNRIILAGDAAGLADPLLGEGIFNAVKSGQMAALAVDRVLPHETSVGPVYNDLISGIKRDLIVCYRTSRWFYQYPGVGYMAMTFFPVKCALLKGFAMGWTMSKIIKNFYHLPFKIPNI
ncbi:MAG: geranylgeranyl reductase family protein [Deltaproteobacteria bacterium]|nr:geranylgeranyl reductase family protein [Deltaproteobacteria bacterium]